MLCTQCLKKVPPLVRYNFDTHEHILIFVGRNVIDKVSNQKTLYFATSNNVCFCTTWQNRDTKVAFFTQMMYQCIARIQPVATWCLQSFWLTTHTHAAVWLPKFSNQCVQLGAVGGILQEKACKSRTPQHLVCVVRTMHVHQYTVFLKEKKCHL